MKIQVLYEDDNFLAIDKPFGMSVHKSPKNQTEYTISDWILENRPNIQNVGEDMSVEYKGEIINISRPGIVHRLDRDTSGVLLIAKNEATFNFLKRQFKKRNIQKIYHTFVYGDVKDPNASLRTGGRGVINAPIGRSGNNIRMWTAGRGAKGETREAITEYIVLKRFDIGNEIFSFLEVYPKTGRTHQIRVHLRYINHPVVSDPLYSTNYEKMLGFNRTALHAKKISFQDQSGKYIEIEAPYPEDFEKTIKEYNLA